jgi:hypothetical protein
VRSNNIIKFLAYIHVGSLSVVRYVQDDNDAFVFVFEIMATMMMIMCWKYFDKLGFVWIHNDSCIIFLCWGLLHHLPKLEVGKCKVVRNSDYVYPSSKLPLLSVRLDISQANYTHICELLQNQTCRPYHHFFCSKIRKQTWLKMLCPLCGGHESVSLKWIY